MQSYKVHLPQTTKLQLSNLYYWISFYICQICKKKKNAKIKKIENTRKKKEEKYCSLVPELKKGQILHLSAGVTLRLYSGNRVWKEVYSHKRAMFCNQIKRRHSWDFLNFVFGLSSYSTVLIKSKTPTKRWELCSQPVVAMVNTWFDPLILQHCVLFTFWGLISENKLNIKSNETRLYISPQRANEKTLAFFTV